MDIKNTLLGLFFIAMGMLVIFMQTKEMKPPKNLEPLVSSDSNESLVISEDSAYTSTDSFDEVYSVSKSNESTELQEADGLSSPSLEAHSESKIYTLANEYIELDLTDRGGSIATVRFLQTKRGALDSYQFNASATIPSLALSFEKAGQLTLLEVPYRVEQISEARIDFIYESEQGLVVRRTFSLEDSSLDPYSIKHTTSLRNGGTQALVFKNLYLNLGTSFPLNDKEFENYLTVGTFDGRDTKFTPINKVKANAAVTGNTLVSLEESFLRNGRFDWVSLQNQYFVSLLSASIPARSVQVFPVSVQGEPDLGLSCNVAFAFDTIGANESRTLETEFYVGPKEYKRLQGLGNYQDKVMQFGWFGFFSKLLLYFMSTIHSFVPNWGWSIVIMTIIIKLIFWPLTAKAAESQKGMTKIQAPMAELKKKYENNPQKLQQETLKLFKEHGVNPLAGCFPILIQMPIFLGLFYMLRTAAELRYERFLWVSDLSQADTIAVVAGFPINLFPLLMGLTMYLQMQITPMSPTADPIQQKIFKFMPFIFLIFLYNFSSGLVIYWTTQNILTIIQQKMIHAKKEPEIVSEDRVQKARPIDAKVDSLKKKSRN